MIYGKNRFLLLFCFKVFLRHWRPLVQNFSAILRLEVEEKGEERTKERLFINSASQSPVVVADWESLHSPNNKVKSRRCRTCRHPSAVVRSWLVDKEADWKRCSLLKLLLVQLPKPDLCADHCRHNIPSIDVHSETRQLSVSDLPPG